jgi:hypothetical protein
MSVAQVKSLFPNAYDPKDTLQLELRALLKLDNVKIAGANFDVLFLFKSGSLACVQLDHNNGRRDNDFGSMRDYVFDPLSEALSARYGNYRSSTIRGEEKRRWVSDRTSIRLKIMSLSRGWGVSVYYDTSFADSMDML